MDLPEEVETERLRMRRLTPLDLEFVAWLHSDPEVTRYLGGDGEPRSREASREWLERTIGWYGSHGVGQFLVVERATGMALGRAGFGYFEIAREPLEDGSHVASWGPDSADPALETERILEVGYTLARSAWGSGFATEAARAWYELAQEREEVGPLGSVIHRENIGSRRVAEKNGLVRSPRPLWLEGAYYDLFVPPSQRGDARPRKGD